MELRGGLHGVPDNVGRRILVLAVSTSWMDGRDDGQTFPADFKGLFP